MEHAQSEHEIKEYKLLTLEQLRNKLKHLSIRWDENKTLIDNRMAITIEYNEKRISWYISNSSIKRFGTMIKAKRIIAPNFTHRDINNEYLYHELWFAPNEEFIGKDDFKI